MARQLRLVPGKDHGPGEVGRTAVELAIDEIGEPAEEEPDGGGCRHGIGQMEEAELVAPGEEDHGEDHAEEAAMERHAAMPESEDLQWVLQIDLEIVEQYVAEP